MELSENIDATAHQQSLMMHSGRLADRLHAFVLVRFVVGIIIVVGACFAKWMVGIADLRVDALSVLALILLACNSVSFLISRSYRGQPHRAHARRNLILTVLNSTIAIDFIILAVALWLVGGVQSPFKAFFIFNVIIASVLLSARAAYAHAFFGYLLLILVVLLPWFGWVPTVSPEGAVPSTEAMDGRFVLTVLSVQGVLIGCTAMLVTYLMRLLHAREERLVHTNCRLEDLSRQRRDFLHIALHNLRSPIGAVGMHLNNLQAGHGGALNPEQQQWVDRCVTRTGALTSFLNDLESLASLEFSNLEDQIQRVDVSKILEDLVEENQDLALEAKQRLRLEIDGALPPIKGIERLVHEAVINYVTNAIKYSLAEGEIVVRAARRENCIRIEVQDQGIGVPEEEQQVLFREFVRAHKKRPDAAHIAGSGLGLFIVAEIARFHRGRVDMRSVEGSGSTFAIEFPVAP
jgi:signal transduction histidine kinase